MEQLTRRLYDWLCENDISVEGVRVVIEFPKKDSASRAEAAIKRDFQYLQLHASTGSVRTLNGIALSLRGDK